VIRGDKSRDRLSVKYPVSLPLEGLAVADCGVGLGCAVIFASKRNEAKRKRNFFRFDAKKSDFFACFASMRNKEI
jgi:hypothetical protein